MRAVCLALLAAALLLLAPPGCRGAGEPGRRCEEITIPMCRGIGYNFTYMPNQFNHDTQEEAGLEVHQFWPLVEIQCSPDLKFFLCSMYTPLCMASYHKPLPACRAVCERAQAGCAPLMRQYGFAWPERMKCDELPRYGDKDQLCMDFNRTQEGRPKATTTPPPRTAAAPSPRPGGPGVGGCECRCNHVPVLNTTHALYGAVTTGGVPNCAMNCHSPYFTSDERRFAAFWLGLWSALCLASTLTTLLTFAIDPARFSYPERPIVFISACYAAVSVGYIVRLALGHEAVACDGDTVRYRTTGPAPCTVVFLLTYFFSMASSIWWVVLSFTWFLSAGLKWGQEAIASYSHHFHLAAWLVPSVKSIAVLALSSVDGDPLAGVCSVGNASLLTLRGFVLAPLCFYLLLGVSFLLAGFVSLFRIRSVIKAQGRSKTEKLEKLMIRICVFSALYTVPATVVIGCHFYEQSLRPAWERAYNCPCSPHPQKPDFSVFILKYLMSLVVGITSGFWVWSGKTLDSWRRFYARCCCCHGNGASAQYQPAPRLNKYSPNSAALAGNNGAALAGTGVGGGGSSTYSGSNKQMPLSHV